MNWRFSFQLGTTNWDAYIWAVFSVALDVTKWLMLPYAAVAGTTQKSRAAAAILIWLVATMYSFGAAIGFAALNREHAASEHLARSELHQSLATMRTSPRWQSSAACADATTPASREFCAHYRAAEDRVTRLPTSEADPQSTLLARLTGLGLETVRIALAVFLATACEVVSALGLFVVMNARPVPPPEPPIAQRWQPPPWRQTSGRDVTRHNPTHQDASGQSK
jgi:hypothetical protein